MNLKSKEFTKLKNKWYSKLEKSGFKDIEQPDGYLKVWSTTFYRAAHVNRITKEQYYRLAGHFLHEFDFESELEKELWEMHSLGVSTREISSKMAKRKITMSKSSVHMIIKDLKQKMIKMYE